MMPWCAVCTLTRRPVIGKEGVVVCAQTWTLQTLATTSKHQYYDRRLEPALLGAQPLHTSIPDPIPTILEHAHCFAVLLEKVRLPALSCS